MKKFNLAKGLVIGLLTLALCLTCFGYVKASAAEGDKHKITFKAKDGETVVSTYEVEYTEGKAGTEDDDAVEPDPQGVSLEDIITGLTKDLDVIYVKSGDLTGGAAGKAIVSANGITLTATADGDYEFVLPVKAPVVTFNVTVKDLTQADDNYPVYTYKAGTSFQKEDASMTISDILANVKTGGDLLDDPTAWVFLSATANDEKMTATSEKVTLAKNLTDDLSINFTVVNSKLIKQFSYDDYTAEFEVENKKGDTKILFTDIVDKLTKTEGEGDSAVTKSYVEENGESVILADGFGSNVTAKGKYTTWYYTVSVDEVKSTALAVSEIGGEKLVPAFSKAGYDPATDSIVFESPVDLTLYWIDCKKAAGVQVKGEKLGELALAQNKEKTAYEASIPLNDKTTGVKVAESKTAYIYASFKTPSEEKAKYTANYIVDATPYKKVTVTYAYAQAEEGSTDGAIASVTTVDTSKKTVIYSGIGKDDETNLSDIIGDLQYSYDGTDWYKISGNTDAKNDFTQDTLYTLITGGSKTTLYFRIQGAAAVEAAEAKGTEGEEGYVAAVDAKNAYRASKAAKIAVTPAKAGKAVKVDVTKDTIALKNGYDFTMTATEKGTPALMGEGGTAVAFTILPFNNAGKAYEVEGTGDDAKEVLTAVKETIAYVPAAKVTEDGYAFTNIKVKTYSIEKIVEKCGVASIGGSGNLYIWIRKSATAKKPAELWTLVTVSQKAEKPTIATAKGVSYYVAQDVDDTKGIVKGIEVSNAKSDKNSGAYEYLIVDAADIKAVDGGFEADIDFTTAKWTTLSDKGVTVAKSKSKYASEEGKKATDHVLKEGSAVLIRRAGDKQNNILASDYIVTMIAKETVSYKDADNKDQEKSLYVWKPFTAAAE